MQQSQESSLTASPAKPGFFRYIAAIFYDLILVIAVLLLATAIFHFLNNDSVRIQSSLLAFRLYLLSISFIFYGWFWTHGGQTLGLRAWKLRLVDHEQTDINWKQVFTRYITACISWLCLGLGILWCLWQKDGKTWQDLSSKSDIIHIES